MVSIEDKKPENKGLTLAQILGMLFFSLHIAVMPFISGESYFPHKPAELVVAGGIGIATADFLLFWLIFARRSQAKIKVFTVFMFVSIGSALTYSFIAQANSSKFKHAMLEFSQAALVDHESQSTEKTSKLVSQIASSGKLSTLESHMKTTQHERLQILAEYAKHNQMLGYSDLLSFGRYLSDTNLFDRDANTLRSVLANIEKYKEISHQHAVQIFERSKSIQLGATEENQTAFRKGAERSFAQDTEGLDYFWEVELEAVHTLDLLIGVLLTHYGSWKIEEGLPVFEDPAVTKEFKSRLLSLRDLRNDYLDGVREGYRQRAQKIELVF